MHWDRLGYDDDDDYSLDIPPTTLPVGGAGRRNDLDGKKDTNASYFYASWGQRVWDRDLYDTIFDVGGELTLLGRVRSLTGASKALKKDGECAGALNMGGVTARELKEASSLWWFDIFGIYDESLFSLTIFAALLFAVRRRSVHRATPLKA